MKRLALLLAAILATAGLQAGETLYASSRVESRWLNIPLSGRMAALAGTGAARGQLPGAVEINPASLAGSPGTQYLFTHNAWAQSVSVDRLATTHHLGCYGTLAASLDYLSLGTVEEFQLDASGQPRQVGTLSPSSMALGAAWARDFGRWSMGAALRGLFENEVDEGFRAGLRGSLGMRYLFSRNSRAGLAVQNLNLDFGDTLRPLKIRGGVGYTFGDSRPLAADLDLEYQVNDQEAPALRAGLEWAMATRWILRGGYTIANERTPSGPSGGIGFIAGRLFIDYAIYGAGDLGLAHLVSMRVAM